VGLFSDRPLEYKYGEASKQASKRARLEQTEEGGWRRGDGWTVLVRLAGLAVLLERDGKI
jgi:hypothetical protein